jgi:hypothetical protein
MVRFLVLGDRGGETSTLDHLTLGAICRWRDWSGAAPRIARSRTYSAPQRADLVCFAREAHLGDDV